jgi:hypothetical protein
MEQNTPQQTSECKTCKDKQTPNMILKNNWWVFVASFYILFASVYGTIHLFKEFIHLFR